MKRLAYVIRTAGDPRLCRAMAAPFEGPEVRRLRLENAALRASNSALRRLELDALRREIDHKLYGRRVLGPVLERFWALAGTTCVIYDKIKRRFSA